MRWHVAVVALLMLCLTACAKAQGDPVASPENSEKCTYTVKSGDTLSGIAEIYGIELKTLQDLNPEALAKVLQIGQELNVPCGGPVLCSHTLSSGDTYGSLAKRYGIELADMEALNPGVHPQQLRVGQDINVPCGGPSNCTYTIQTGDTLAKVAAIYDLDVDAIETLNPDISARDLVLGQVLLLPCNGTEVARGSNSGSSSKTTTGCTFPIKAGMTLATIARAFNIEVAELEALNPGLDATTLQIDEEINVPCTDATYCTYYLKEGDTLAALVAAIQTYKADVNLDTLGELNPDLEPTKLVVGELMWVPCPCTYKVKATDTGAGILTQLGATAEKLMAFNPGLNLNELKVDQVLIVPCPASIPS